MRNLPPRDMDVRNAGSTNLGDPQCILRTGYDGIRAKIPGVIIGLAVSLIVYPARRVDQRIRLTRMSEIESA